ncbi:n/a [Ectocarpus siliculosus]|uniref:non-specific serine/threonine protein kinase n=1 Tax=Ectocarpus siliculosus TaxID=2880 RepID=D8LL15_ECTSI|nr:n/a [Ectocarpus siliculosus]|eukprot:CBN76109.1 n/a [Ectocarpus siliculosus]
MGLCLSKQRAKDGSADSVRSHMVRERKGTKVEDLYETISVIGKGSVGMISKVKHRQTGVEYALKTIQLEKISRSMLKEMRNEIEILKRLDHPNIIRAIETFESDKEVYLVMRLCTGGDLHRRAPYAESAVVDIITKLLSATWYMHQQGIVHRDLKLENVVYESTLPDSDIFIIDYGLSKIIERDEDRMNEVVGTLYTMAPEVLNGGVSYDKSCDMWSIGVIAFVLLSGDMPFDTTTKQRLIKAVEDGRFEFSGRRWNRVSSEARSFIRHMMVKKPSGRYTAGQALQHSWIQGCKLSDEQRMLSPAPTVFEKEDHDRVVVSMKNFALYSKVKRTALMLVAYRSKPEETKAMRSAFKAYDVDQNGRVSRAEFQKVLKKQGYSDAELVGLFDEVDDDHDGFLHYTEFLAATLETGGKEMTDERLAEAFDLLDMDDSGSISKENLLEFLGKDSKGYDVTQLIAEADEDGTGAINLHEFCNHMRKRVSSGNEAVSD